MCPEHLACDEVHRGCVLPEQLVTCRGAIDDTPCTIAGAQAGVCRDGVCLGLRCGDGVVVGLEECDGPVTMDCLDFGYYEPGPVTCRSDCTFDRSQCQGRCGDGVLDPGHEDCDGVLLPAGVDCRNFGFYDQVMPTCNGLCKIDVSFVHGILR